MRISNALEKGEISQPEAMDSLASNLTRQSSRGTLGLSPADEAAYRAALRDAAEAMRISAALERGDISGPDAMEKIAKYLERQANRAQPDWVPSEMRESLQDAARAMRISAALERGEISPERAMDESAAILERQADRK
jgi:hypothetical protein